MADKDKTKEEGEDNFALTNEQKDIAKKWLTEKSGEHDLRCSICDHNDWFIADHLLGLPVYKPDPMFWTGGGRYPFVQIICTNCGHTLLVNSLVMGVSKLSATTEKAAPQDQEDADG